MVSAIVAYMNEMACELWLFCGFIVNASTIILLVLALLIYHSRVICNAV